MALADIYHLCSSWLLLVLGVTSLLVLAFSLFGVLMSALLMRLQYHNVMIRWRKS